MSLSLCYKIALVLTVIQGLFCNTTTLQSLEAKINKLSQETKYLKEQNFRLWSEISSFDEYCSMAAEGKCGPCRCRDNFKLSQKYYCDCRNLPAERDCRAFYESGSRINGLYKVHNNNMKLMQVYCDQATDGGGWTVFQRRTDGSEIFYRDWDNYKNGFGDLTNEFWMGNANLYIHSLQSLPKRSELRIELGLWDGTMAYAKYSNFQIGDELTFYRIHLSHYSGNAGDGFTAGGKRVNGHAFSTYDKDNDANTANCAAMYKGGWWYDKCHLANLNGLYYGYKDYTSGAKGIHWYSLDQHKQTMKSAEMKMRRK